MSPKEKKQVRSIVLSLIEQHNVHELGIISHLTLNRAFKVAELHGKDLMTVACFLADFDRRQLLVTEIIDMIFEVKDLVTISDEGNKCVNYTKLTEHLIDNGFSCELFVMEYDELLEAHTFITRLYDAHMVLLSFSATHNLLSELAIPVIRQTRKTKQDAKSNKGTTK